MRKRTAAVGMIASLAGILSFAALAPAVATIVPTLLTAKMSPTQRLKQPYRFTVSGTLTYPKQVCPKGTKSGRYCVKVQNVVCTGKIQVTVKLLHDRLLAHSFLTISTGRTSLKSNCQYSFTTKIPRSMFTARIRKIAPHAKGRYVGIAFFVVFLGNSSLTGKSAHRRVVRGRVYPKVHAAGK